ncbi:MAG: phage major capsid protein, partial [Lentisphaerae bacterium]|nr:phage major capsid protein [Lentisphaerota bacterium]
MNKIIELREKRAKLWETTKAFLDSRRNENGLLSAEDTATYTKMEEDVMNLGKEIERLERQAVIDLELSKPTSSPISNKPGQKDEEEKTGRASNEYKKAFWNAMRMKNPNNQIYNSLSIGEDSEGGYLAPDEFERTLITTLEEENIFRKLAKVIKTSSGDRKIPVVVTKGSAAWLDEGEDFEESDSVFGQTSIGAYKIGTMIKVSDELLNDSVFSIESYIATEFARRIGAKEEEAFLVGDGDGKPTGIFNATAGGELGVTAASATAITADEIIDLVYSLKAPYRK